jgi:very-short-patch-repair endonuclease
MDDTNPPTSYTYIPTDTFAICLIDGLSLKEICKLYSRSDIRPNSKNPIAYRLDKFAHHLKVVHNITLIEYCQRYNICEWPKCPIRGTLVGYRIEGKGIRLSRYAQGAIDTTLPANQAFYKRMSEERKGEGNPMYDKEPWSKGITRAMGDERVERRFVANENRVWTDEQRAASRERLANLIAKRGPLHAMPHSEETKELARRNTARLWAEGVFKRTSSIHLKMRALLQSLPLKQPFVEEHQVKWFSMDFAFPNIKLAIEVQGSYYHVDPRFYPNGPETAMQRRNWGRDTAKRKVCCDQEGWTIIEAWEPEINNGSFANDIICKLKQYDLLDSSVSVPPLTSP